MDRCETGDLERTDMGRIISDTVYRTVVCTPGSLAAYRRAALMPHLEAYQVYLWLERDFDFVYDVIYSYFAFFLLQWIYPYAFVTVRDCRRLTR